jgi:hypothetical protein
MRKHAWKCWVIMGVAATVGYLAARGPTGRDAVYLAVGLASVAAILIGTVLHRTASAGACWPSGRCASPSGRRSCRRMA